MRASELIDLLSQYDPEMDVPVSFSENDEGDSVLEVASCANQGHGRCYQNIVELAQDGMMVVDPRDRLTYMNPFLCRLLDYGARDLFGRDVTSLLSADEVQSFRRRTEPLRAGRAQRFCIHFRARGGALYWMHVSATPIPSVESGYRGSMMTVSDLGLRKAHEMQVRDQDTLGTKIERVAGELERLRIQRVGLLAELAELESQLRIDARPYWHQQRYLYLIRPQKNGRRKREYIGARPERIREALDAVEREQRYQGIRAGLDHVEARIRTVTFKLDSFLWELAQVPPDLHRLVG